MKLVLVVTRLAELDLDELIVWIGEKNPKAAIQVAQRILQRIELLAEHPELGRTGRCAGTRELIIDGTRYIVVYQHDIINGQIQILRILHSSTMWPEAL